MKTIIIDGIEYNLTPKARFKKGDWVVLSTSDGEKVVQIDSIEYFKSGEPRYITSEARWFGNGTKARLWNITQDAKDGDVLYLQHDGKEHIIIYKGVIKERFRTFVSAYCAYNGIVDAFCFADVSRYTDIAYEGIVPATKEQRTTLFQKMHEAGYMWDTESKQLLSLKAEPSGEQKPTDVRTTGYWHVEDAMKEVEEKAEAFTNAHQGENADEILAQMRGEKNSAWSEEDEQYLLVCKNALVKYQTTDKWDARIISHWIEDKLKSLRPQSTWKPTEEQMDALETAVSSSQSTAKTMIERACEWIQKNCDTYYGFPCVYPQDLINDFRKALEE